MARFSLKLFMCFLVWCLRFCEAGFCTEPYSCDSTCYRYSTYKASCGNAECYKSRLEPYICQETCYKKVCCKGYTGDDCQTPTCFGDTTCPNGGRCVAPDACICLPGYFGTKCRKCGLLPSIQNGQFKLYTTGPNTNTRARLECSSGYTQHPDSNVHLELYCDDDGYWSPDGFNHTCQLTDCGIPDRSIQHGRYVTLQGTAFGNQAVLNCDDGYKSISLFPIQCLASGVWSESTGASCELGSAIAIAAGSVCKPGQCADPYSFCDPITMTCRCKDGYQMTGAGCKGNCPFDGWERFGDSCYYFGDTEFYYREARTFCNQFNSDVYNSSLVQIDTIEELIYVKSYIRKRAIQPSNGYWNDLFQNTTNGVDEYWRRSGDPLVVADWDKNEPNRQDESCTFFYKPLDYRWADVNCANSEKKDETDNVFTAFALCEVNLV